MDKTAISGAFRQVQANIARLTEMDQARIAAYLHDLSFGLKEVRSFPQGVTIFGSSRVGENNEYYKQARQLGRLLAQNDHAVTTGGGPGIMEAANRGAFEQGGRSIGFNIYLPHEQHANPYLTDEIDYTYFFARKVMLAMASKAYVYFPGGFGTMDELSELLVLVQEEKMPKMPIFLIGSRFWKPLDKFFQSRMQKSRLIVAADRKIYTITDDINDVVAAANRLGHPKVRDNLYDKF